MDKHDKVLHDYMAQVMKLQRERHQRKFTQDELDEIARQSGMSDEDLRYVHERHAALMSQGEAFLRYKNWQDAATAFEQATMLSPSDPNALTSLGRAYYERGHAGGNREDIDNARLFAEQALEIDHDYDPAIRLMSDIRSGAGSRPSAGGSASASAAARPQAARPVILAAAMAVAIGIAGMVMFFAVGTESSDPDVVAVEASPAPEAPEPATDASESETSEEPEPPGFATKLLAFGEEGIGPGMFDDARRAAVDGQGNIYVGEYSSARIQAFDPSGKFITQWTPEDAGYLPGLAAGLDGRVYALYNGRIHVYDGATGKQLETIRHAPGFNDVVAMPDGGLLASWNEHYQGGMFMNVGADDSRDKFIRINSDGRVTKTIDRPMSKASRSFVLDTKLATDGRDNIYATERSGSSIYRFTTDGEFVDKFSASAPGGSGRVADIAVDGWGRVYVAGGGDIRVFDPEGRLLTTFELDGSPSAIAIAQNNQLVVVYRDHVEKFEVKKPEN